MQVQQLKIGPFANQQELDLTLDMLGSLGETVGAERRWYSVLHVLYYQNDLQEWHGGTDHYPNCTPSQFLYLNKGNPFRRQVGGV